MITKSTLSSAWRYASLGLILGLGSPAGLLVLRFLKSIDGNVVVWFLNEWYGMQGIYVYVTVGTVTAFSIFGYWLGRREDKLEEQTQCLEQRAQAFEHLSITDGLTGLHTHTYAVSRLGEELQRAHRYRLPLACLFMDIDNFKALNDRFGHPFGDRVLTELAKVLRLEMRESDVLARYGGDEFLAILPQTDGVAAYGAAERIRVGVESLLLEGSGGFKSVTVSVGVYASTHLPSSASDMLELADRALRMAKNSGKNRTATLSSVEKDNTPAQEERGTPHALREVKP